MWPRTPPAPQLKPWAFASGQKIQFAPVVQPSGHDTGGDHGCRTQAERRLAKHATPIEQQAPFSPRIHRQQVVESVAIKVGYYAACGKIGAWRRNRRQSLERHKICVAAIQQHLRTIWRPQHQVEFAIVIEIGNLCLSGGSLQAGLAAWAEARASAIDVEQWRAVIAQYQQIGKWVVSKVGEQRASCPPNSPHPSRLGNVCESSVAIVAIKMTGGAGEILREAETGLPRRMRQVGVHADEQVEQPIIVRIEEQRLRSQFPGFAF